MISGNEQQKEEEEEGRAITSIMDKYDAFSPKYKVLYANQKKSLKVYEVRLCGSLKFVLKQQMFSSEDENQIRKIKLLYREYSVGKALSECTDGVAGVLDFQEYNAENGKIIIEILLKHEGLDLEECSKAKKLQMRDIVDIGLQVLNTLAIMECVCIAHSDIKPANITWNKDEKLAKIIDLGAVIIRYGGIGKLVNKEISRKRLTEYTECYAAPEVLKPRGLIEPHKADVFSFCVMLLTLINSVHSITIGNRSLGEAKAAATLCNGSISFDANIRDSSIGCLVPILERCLRENKEDRPSIEQLRREMMDVLQQTEYCELVEKSQDPLLAVISLMQKYKSNKPPAIKKFVECYREIYEKFMQKNQSHRAKHRRYPGRVCASLGFLYLLNGNESSGIKWLKKSATISETEDDVTILPIVYDALAQYYSTKLKFRTAIQTYKKSLNIHSTMTGEENLSKVLTTYPILAHLYSELGKHEEAEELMNRATEMYNKLRNEKVLNNEQTIEALALIYWHRQDYDEALKLCNKFKSNNKPLSLETVLLLVHCKKGNKEEARKCIKRMTDICTRLFEKYHPSCFEVYALIGYVTFAIDKTESITYLKKAIEVAANINLKNTSKVKLLYAFLGIGHCFALNAEEGLKELENCVSINAKLHLNIDYLVHFCLAWLYARYQDGAKSKEYSYKSYDLCTKRHKENSKSTLVLTVAISYLHVQLGNEKEADEWLRRIENCCDALPSEKVSVISARRWLFKLNYLLRRFEKAIHYASKFIKTYENTPEGSGFHTIRAYLDFAKANLKLEKYYACLPYTEEALKLFNNLPESASSEEKARLAGRIYFNLAQSYESRGEYKEAIVYFNASLENGLSGLKALTVYCWLEFLYTRLGNLEKAEECAAKITELDSSIDKKYLRKKIVIYAKMRHVYMKISMLDKATTYCTKAFDLSTELDEAANEIQIMTRYFMAELYIAQKNYSKALVHLERLHHFYKGLASSSPDDFVKNQLIIFVFKLAEANFSSNNYEAAFENYTEFFSLISHIPECNSEMLITAHYAMACLSKRFKDDTQALFHFQQVHALYQRRPPLKLEDKMKSMLVDMELKGQSTHAFTDFKS